MPRFKHGNQSLAYNWWHEEIIDRRGRNAAFVFYEGMNMTKEEFYKLYNPISVENGRRYLNVVLDAYFVMMDTTHRPIVHTAKEQYAQIILQMFFTKGLAISKLLEGISYRHGTVSLNPIIDHTQLFILARNLCETLSAYELICVIPDSSEKRLIMVNLFENSGYGYRLRFYSEQLQKAHKEQYQQEQQIVRNARETISNTEYYQSLSPQQKKDFKKYVIKKKSFQVILQDDGFRTLSWQKALHEYVAPNGLFDNIYMYFCLNTHPSIISMNQFNQAFAAVNPEYPHMCLTAIQYIISFLSMFLQEYIAVFQKAQEIFEGQNEDIKWLLTLYDYRKTK